MKIVIPYREFGGQELKYCLRGIEKYIDDPEITIIGDLPKWIKNVIHIPYKDNKELRWKERNIFSKIMLVDHDFLFFNDDHYLLAPFDESTYHYSGMLNDTRISLNNSFSRTLFNTIEIFGNIPNYFRHCPMFCKIDILRRIEKLNWNKEWGYCIKSIYCYLAQIEGTEYPDMKIRSYLTEQTIKNMISGRPYFSTGNHSMNGQMIKVLNELYSNKSKFEI